jgi:YbbR domain-containing protein
MKIDFVGVKRLLLRAWKSVNHNFSYKLLSVLVALGLWSYVLYSNPSIMQKKTISGVEITISGQSVLSSRGLALSTDVASALSSARVTVQVSQSGFALVSADNVRVELDLSTLRRTGTQTVRLKGTTTYGVVAQVWPESVEVTVENQDQRYVPVNPQITGEQMDGYWYNVSRPNPSQITVTGPTSLVQMVSSAEVDVDVTGRTSAGSLVGQLRLLDASGDEINADYALSRSTSSITVAFDIYPVKQLTVTADADEATHGAVRRGYALQSIEVYPDTVMAAADQSLLDTLDHLSIEAIDISGADRTFTQIVDISMLKGIKYLSSDQVSATVNIVEQELTKRYSNMEATPMGLDAALRVNWSSPRLEVRLSGPYSAVQSLSRNDVVVWCDLEGYSAGVYDVPIQVTVDNYPDLSVGVEPATVRMTLTEKAAVG